MTEVIKILSKMPQNEVFLSKNNSKSQKYKTTSNHILSPPLTDSTSKTSNLAQNRDATSSNTSKTVWKNLSQLFVKESKENDVFQLIKKNKSPIKRLSSYFRSNKLSKNPINPLTNIGISPCGYQAAFSKKHNLSTKKNKLAIAIKIPKGTSANNVAVTMELDVLKKDHKTNLEDLMKMHCVDETKSQTIFAGTIKVPSDTDFNKLTNIPLYLIDSKKKFVLKPGSELVHRTVFSASQNSMSKLSSNNLKVILKLDKRHNWSTKEIDPQSSNTENLANNSLSVTTAEISSDSSNSIDEVFDTSERRRKSNLKKISTTTLTDIHDLCESLNLNKSFDAEASTIFNIKLQDHKLIPNNHHKNKNFPLNIKPRLFDDQFCDVVEPASLRSPHVCDIGIQYSNTFFTSTKAMATSRSSENLADYFSGSTTTTFSSRPTILLNRPSQTDHSTVSADTEFPATSSSTNTRYSGTLLSYISGDLQVPLNSPSTPPMLNPATNNFDVSVTTKRPNLRKANSNCTPFAHISRQNKQEIKNLGDLSISERELCNTTFESSLESIKSDKTLQLLENARRKLKGLCLPYDTINFVSTKNFTFEAVETPGKKNFDSFLNGDVPIKKFYQSQNRSQIWSDNLIDIDRKISTELDELREMYREMCFGMDVILKSKTPTAKTKELKTCLSNINKVLESPHKTVSKVNLSKFKETTYSNMQKDKEKVITNLIGTKIIKDAVIQIGTKEETETFFSYVPMEPTSIAKPDDMTSILDTMLDEVFKNDPSKKREEIGDVTTRYENKKNDILTYFPNVRTKIPKTSYSFGEVSGNNFELLNPKTLKTPTRLRDGLTITEGKRTRRNLKSKLLMNKLINFNVQPNADESQECDSRKFATPLIVRQVETKCENRNGKNPNDSDSDSGSPRQNSIPQLLKCQKCLKIAAANYSSFVAPSTSRKSLDPFCTSDGEELLQVVDLSTSSENETDQLLSSQKNKLRIPKVRRIKICSSSENESPLNKRAPKSRSKSKDHPRCAITKDGPSKSQDDSTVAEDEEYEGDHESEVNLPIAKQRYISKQDLNTPEEILEIEKNLEANEQLNRKGRIVLVASGSSSNLKYEESFNGSETQSENLKNDSSQESNEIKVIEMDPEEIPLQFEDDSFT